MSPVRSRLSARSRHMVGCAVAAALLAGALLLPAVAGPYVVALAATGLVLTVLAFSVHLLMVAGLPSLGQAAYLGVGASTTAHLATAGITLAPLHLLVAGAAGALAAALTAPVVLRTRATTFLMVTFAIGELVHTSAQHWATVTGGDQGIQVPPVILWPGGTPLRAQAGIYWYTLTVVLAVTGGLALLGRTRHALAWRAIADHEPRMHALGHPVNRQLLACHLLTGGVAGLGGALLVAVNHYVCPADLDFTTATLALLAVALGSGRLLGILAAAVGIIAVRDGIGTITAGHSLALLGLAFLTMAYRQPITRWLHTRRTHRAEAT
ncbi:MAG: branched-chain amino acid ABC transporter permease [Micromonosporaceae bacterium]|nr:branched-chain amino acid ABC transporter permease [Micromonosporaceae bacterium]